MTKEKLEHDLLHACELTQQIIDCSSDIKTDHIVELDSQRNALIQHIFSHDKQLINLQLSKRLLELNQLAVEVIKNQLNVNLTQQKKQRLGSKAHHAYTGHL